MTLINQVRHELRGVKAFSKFDEKLVLLRDQSPETLKNVLSFLQTKNRVEAIKLINSRALDLGFVECSPEKCSGPGRKRISIQTERNLP
jgi:hypothetical protein